MVSIIESEIFYKIFTTIKTEIVAATAKHEY